MLGAIVARQRGGDLGLRRLAPLVPLPPVRPRKPRGADLTFDARTHLHRLTGVDLTRLDGLQAHTVLNVVAEVGLDMTRWPSEKHFASWLALAPGTNVSGGKKLSSRTKPSANRAAAALPHGGQLAAPQSVRLGRLLPTDEDPPRGAEGHHRHGPQAREFDLPYAPLRHRIRRSGPAVLRGPLPTACPLESLTRRARDLGY